MWVQGVSLSSSPGGVGVADMELLVKTVFAVRVEGVGGVAAKVGVVHNEG